MNHARGDMAPRLLGLRIGQVIEVEYSNGESELFIVDCKRCTFPAFPIQDSCGG